MAPFTVRTTVRAALFTLLPRLFLPLVVLTGLLAVPFALEVGILAFIGVLVGAFLAAGLRGDFVSAFGALPFAGDLAGDLVGDPPPFAALTMIFLLVSVEGRLSWLLFLAGEVTTFADAVFRWGPRMAALNLDAALTLGNLTVFFSTVLLFVWPRAVEIVVVFLVVVLPRAVVTLFTAFLTPALMDFALSSLRFFGCAVAVPAAVARFRFAPPVLATLTLAASALARWSLSFGRGPRMPRQFGAPQRHCWTFLLE